MGKCCICGERIRYNKFVKAGNYIYCKKCYAEIENDAYFVEEEKVYEEVDDNGV